MATMLLERTEDTNSNILGRLGSLEARLAVSEMEIEAALDLRKSVFRGLKADCSDRDALDENCEHLLIVETADSGDPLKQPVVATYRLLGQDRLGLAGDFYSQAEFNIRRLLNGNPNLRFLEFGRSCVDPQYRQKRTIELLWHGSWAYVRRHGYDVMFGCASFPGTSVEQHAVPLAFLAKHAPATGSWYVPAIAGKAIKIADLPVDVDLEDKAALRLLPPLIKGYLRLGARFSTEVVVDPVFGTIDVLVVLPLSNLNPRYVAHYGVNAERYASD